MAKKSKHSAKPSPESFSFYLLNGESLVCPPRTITPTKGPYLVDLKTVELDTSVLRTWFIQSIVPLVGDAAAARLKELMEAREEVTADFLKEALKFRQGLK
jgi:hypothetical protein